jgi:PPE-repeat protein
MMDYLALPPEINSARIESGPGAAPLMEAATAWSMLAAGIESALSQHVTVTSATAAVWLGPGASAFSAASASFETWMTATAMQALQSATAATMAAAAYETTRAAMVPLVAVLENRAQLMALVATNFLGQNTPAIMATEAIYMEMWAQDIAAMVSYQTESAAATAQLTPAQPAPQTTTGVVPTGISQAATTSVMPAQTTLSGVVSDIENTLFGGSFNSVFGNSFIDSNLFNGILGASGNLLGGINPATLLPTLGMLYANQDQARQAQIANELNEKAWVGSGSVDPGAVSSGATGATSSAPEAAMGTAKTSGALSVPPSWDKSTQQVKLASAATPLTEAGRMPGMMPTPIAAVNGPERKQRNANEILVRVKFVPTEGV